MQLSGSSLCPRARCRVSPPLGPGDAAPVLRGEEWKGHGAYILPVSRRGFGFPCCMHSEGRVHGVIARKGWELWVLKNDSGPQVTSWNSRLHYP